MPARVRKGLIPIGEVRGDTKTSLAADAHALDPLFQSGDRAPLSDAEGVMLILLDEVAAIEEEVVADLDFGAAMGGRTLTELDVLVLDPAPAALHRHCALSPGGFGASAGGDSAGVPTSGVPAFRCRFASFFCFLARSR